jgi:hypothetical protein
LYVVNIAREELRAWQQFIDARSHMIMLSNRAEVDAAVEATERAGAHLWFRCGEPTAYDRMREANHRVWKAWDKKGPLPIPDLPPNRIPADEVGYYNDVVDRLKALQIGAPREMTTGFSASPMW